MLCEGPKEKKAVYDKWKTSMMMEQVFNINDVHEKGCIQT